MGADQNSLYTDQQSLLGTPTEEEEGVDHGRYLASHRKQESPEEESHGHQIREERCRQQYREADRTVKRMIRADKLAYMGDLTNQAEEAASKGEQGQVYRITKLVSGKYRGATDAPIVDKQGRLLTTEAEQEARWVEHFSEVLNRPPQQLKQKYRILILT